MKRLMIICLFLMIAFSLLPSQAAKLYPVDPNCSFDANSVVNTTKVTTPTQSSASNTTKPRYFFHGYNYSTVSDFTVKIFNIVSIGGSNRYSLVKTITLPKAVSSGPGGAIDSIMSEVEWMFSSGCPLQFRVSNDTALGSGEGGKVYFNFCY